MKYCPRCGKQVPDGSQYCTSCGLRLNEASEINSNSKFNQQNEENRQQQAKQGTGKEMSSESTNIRYAGGLLGNIKPEIFWPIAGIAYFLICIFNRSSFIFGFILPIIRDPKDSREWKYCIITILIVLVLVNL
ncbi:zinc-ribbon domain-containing protein [Companilactobacillus insicii]|uniref:zinc-ribbon domain-containing protein n=1 Tax=Companilactobacillus insicii TaxID=1732567 RepID=UPI000F78D566|nr:zinc ribbon domain-containing protein [Companilactobacillus insicii]